jgi:hypothetical protein
MLNQIVVVPPPGAFWPAMYIPVLGDPIDGIFCHKVDGITPVKANVNTRGYSIIDGEFHSGSQVPKRNIVMHMGLENRGISVAEARRNLYAYFMPKKPVTLRFEFTDRDPVRIDGVVEGCEPDIFAEDVEAQLSIICPMPNFLSETPVVETGTFVGGDIDTVPDTIVNLGDQETGFELQIFNNNPGEGHFLGNLSIQMVTESSPGVYFTDRKLEFAPVFIQGSMTGFSDREALYINSIPGQKEARAVMVEGDYVGQTRSILGGMTEDSVWPKLFSAPNLFRITTDEMQNGEGLTFDWELTFRHPFGGL